MMHLSFFSFFLGGGGGWVGTTHKKTVFIGPKFLILLVLILL